jgi:mono/diheme cytochrome c family protein
VNGRLPSRGWIVGCLALVALASLITLDGDPIVAQEQEPLVTRGKALFMEKGCYGCHTIGKMGTPIAPDLSRVGAKYGEGVLARSLKNPSAQEPTQGGRGRELDPPERRVLSPRHMPKLELSETEAQALAAYLASLR